MAATRHARDKVTTKATLLAFQTSADGFHQTARLLQRLTNVVHVRGYAERPPLQLDGMGACCVTGVGCRVQAAVASGSVVRGGLLGGARAATRGCGRRGNFEGQANNG